MSAEFVIAVIEGFEGTLDAVLDRLSEGELRREVEALQRHIIARRRFIETASRVTAN
jgi:DNA-directed RNA polymerase beta' subunit